VATISASVVKELRDKTGAGMMDCKRALAENDGDMEKALDWLRKKGQAIATKKAAREASEGLVTCKHRCRPARKALIFQLNCETDFVARNEKFIELLDGLAAQVLDGAAESVDALLDRPASPTPPSPSATSSRKRSPASAKTWRSAVSSASRPRTTSPTSIPTSTRRASSASSLPSSAGNAATLQAPAFATLCSDLAMHIAAASPEYLTRDEVPADVIARESDIYREQARNEGKPENIFDKIVAGKIGKWYGQICLLEQAFVKDPDESIRKLLERTGKQLGDSIEPSSASSDSISAAEPPPWAGP
jgi:elongation factor Ts